MKALPHLRTAAGESNTPVSTSERRAQGSALVPGRIDGAEIGSRRADLIEQEDLNCGFPPAIPKFHSYSVIQGDAALFQREKTLWIAIAPNCLPRTK